MIFRTDKHNNPTAFTTDIAKEAGLVEGVDYAQGDPFPAGTTTNPITLHTALLLKDPILTTVQVLDKIGFYTSAGRIRWIYIGIPKWLWDSLTFAVKKQVILFMYGREGGIGMKGIFK